jgi:hypothetical protein
VADHIKNFSNFIWKKQKRKNNFYKYNVRTRKLPVSSKRNKDRNGNPIRDGAAKGKNWVT